MIERIVEPALREGVESGELRLLFAMPDFDGLEPGAMVEDLETGLRAWVFDHSAWRRFALEELDAAREWVAG